MSHPKIYTLLVCLALALSACGGSAASEPQMIASFPINDQDSERPAEAPRQDQYIHDAWIELDVKNMSGVVEEAIEVAYQNGGTLDGTQSWKTGNIAHTKMVLTVPAAYLDTVYNRILALGTPVEQHINGRLVSNDPGAGWNFYSKITVQFNERSSTPRIGGWSPLRTLQSAWNVFVAIFGFLADVIIWLVVVVGPFLVLAYGLHRVVKRTRRSP